MKKMICSAAMALMLLSCGNKATGKAAAADSDTVTTGTEVARLGKNQTKEAAQSLAEEAYTKYFASLQNQGDITETTDGYLSADFKGLLEKGMKKQDVTDDLFFDYDYWINAQDFEGLKVKSVTISYYTPEKAAAEVSFLNFGEINKAYLVLTYNKEKDTWQINDFLDPDSKASFAKGIEDYLAAPTGK